MRPAWIELDLDAYRANVRALAAHCSRPVLAVVKANAYGHGLVPLATAALEAGCPGVGVALPEEGAELRGRGFPGRILVLGPLLEEQADEVVEHSLEPAVSRAEMLRALSAASRRSGRPARVHIKVDTGMTRGGADPADALALCAAVRHDPWLCLAGIMTHFAAADSEDPAPTGRQWASFQPLLEAAARTTPRPLLHAANSPAALWHPATALDWVRGGIITYGVAPTESPRLPLPFPVRPVLALKARLAQLRPVPAGRAVSYGGTWVAPRPSILALAPLGYADGLPWSLSNRGCALVRGCRVPIRGRVCMDQLVLDVTDVPDAAPGDEAVFIGRQGREELRVTEVARAAGTISYEVLTRLSARLPRLILPAPAGSAQSSNPL